MHARILERELRICVLRIQSNESFVRTVGTLGRLEGRRAAWVAYVRRRVCVPRLLPRRQIAWPERAHVVISGGWIGRGHANASLRHNGKQPERVGAVERGGVDVGVAVPGLRVAGVHGGEA